MTNAVGSKTTDGRLICKNCDFFQDRQERNHDGGNCYCDPRGARQKRRCYCNSRTVGKQRERRKCCCDPNPMRENVLRSETISSADTGRCKRTSGHLHQPDMEKPEANQKCLRDSRKNVTDACCSYGDIKNFSPTEELSMDDCLENFCKNKNIDKPPNTSTDLLVQRNGDLEIKKISKNQVELVVGNCSYKPAKGNARRKRINFNGEKPNAPRNQPRSRRNEDRRSDFRPSKRFASQPARWRNGSVDKCHRSLSDYSSRCSETEQTSQPYGIRNRNSVGKQREYTVTQFFGDYQNDSGRFQSDYRGENYQTQKDSLSSDRTYYSDDQDAMLDTRPCHCRGYRNNRSRSDINRRSKRSRKRDCEDTQSDSELDRESFKSKRRKHHTRFCRSHGSRRGKNNSGADQQQKQPGNQPDSQQQRGSNSEVVYLIYQTGQSALPQNQPAEVQQNHQRQMNVAVNPAQKNQDQQQFQQMNTFPPPLQTYVSPPTQPQGISYREGNCNIDDVKKLIIKSQSKLLRDLLFGKSLEQLKAERDKYLRKHQHYSIFDQGDCRPRKFYGITPNTRESEYYGDQYRFVNRSRSQPVLSYDFRANIGSTQHPSTLCCGIPQGSQTEPTYSSRYTQSSPHNRQTRGTSMDTQPNFCAVKHNDSGLEGKSSANINFHLDAASKQQSGGADDAVCQCSPNQNLEPSPKSNWDTANNGSMPGPDNGNYNSGDPDSCDCCSCPEDDQCTQNASTQYAPQCFCYQPQELNQKYDNDRYNRHSHNREVSQVFIFFKKAPAGVRTSKRMN